MTAFATHLEPCMPWKYATAPANEPRPVIFAEKLFPEMPKPIRGCTLTVIEPLLFVGGCATYVVWMFGVPVAVQLPDASDVTFATTSETVESNAVARIVIGSPALFEDTWPVSL